MEFFKKQKREKGGLHDGRTKSVTVKVTAEYTEAAKPSYKAVFIKDAGFTARRAKQTYIRHEYHDRINKILRVIGDGEVSMASYIDNVLAEHFRLHGEEIAEAYGDRLKSYII